MLRSPVLDDEAEVAQAQKELESDYFQFVFQNSGESWPAYVDRVERERLGIDIAADRVSATFLLAEVDGVIVGSVSIAHELNEYLASVGGQLDTESVQTSGVVGMPDRCFVSLSTWQRPSVSTVC